MYLDILLFFSFFFFSLPFFFVTEQNRFVECSTQVLYILPADISYVLRESSVKREQMRSVLASTAQRENGRVFVGLNHWYTYVLHEHDTQIYLYDYIYIHI